MRQVRHPNEAEDMRKVDENIIQIMFMELKAQQLKLVDVANAKAVIVRIAENVLHAKTNLDSAVAEPKNKLAFIEFVLGRILLEKGLPHKLPIWQIHQKVHMCKSVISGSGIKKKNRTNP